MRKERKGNRKNNSNCVAFKEGNGGKDIEGNQKNNQNLQLSRKEMGEILRKWRHILDMIQNLLVG